MEESGIRLPIAVIDTSFWSQCCHLDVLQPLWSTFVRPILVPSMVFQEIFHRPGAHPAQAAMATARQSGELSLECPIQDFALFGAGERTVISLAQERHATALIDDYRPHQYLRHTLQWPVLSVSECIVLWLDTQRISWQEARALANTLAAHGATSPHFLAWLDAAFRTRGGIP